MRHIIATFIALAFVTLVSPAGAASSLDARIDPILAEQQQEQHIPGLVMLVIKDGQIVYAKALGLRDIADNLPATLDTLFPIGSCTKAFTAMTAAIEADEGKLSFDDHPQKFLPYFKMADHEANANVTLRDMLSHRTGLKAYADLAAVPGVLTMDEYMRAATSAKPAVKFRSAYQYSNAMVVAAGEIVGAANHSTWAGAVTQKIFAPLGMNATTANAFNAMQAPDHATGYVYDADTKSLRAAPLPYSLHVVAPAGAIASSAHDMARWLRMLSDGGVFDGKHFVSQAMFDEMTKTQTPINQNLSYGLGWVIYQWNGLKVVEHNGGLEGISALVSFIPSRHAGIVFLANTSTNYMTKIGNAGKLLWPIILDEKPDTAPLAAPTQAAPPAVAAAPTPDASLPTADALIARMIDAEGGARVLRRHTSLLIEAEKSYANQGVTAAYTIRAKAPAMREEKETWSAVGREIGHVRLYFDGAHGGQEATFGRDVVFGDANDAIALRDNTFNWFLSLHRLYQDIQVIGRTKTDGEDAFVMRLTPAKGDPVELTVSVSSALLLARKDNGEADTYADYRLVEGERIPFTRTANGALGEIGIHVMKAIFNVAIPQRAFEPAKAKPH